MVSYLRVFYELRCVCQKIGILIACPLSIGYCFLQCLQLQVVGLLIRARKYKLVSFEGETLFQGTNDKTPIYLLRYFIWSDTNCWDLDILFKFLELSRRSKKFSNQDKIRQTSSGDQLVINNGGFNKTFFHLDFIVVGLRKRCLSQTESIK